MRFRQEFQVAEDVGSLWAFFDQPERVAACIPGVETVDVVDPDTFTVRATQKVGPMSATFESRVHITERVPGERIAFTSTGKAVRGAVGNFRATNAVSLTPRGGETLIVVEGEAALAGVLGTIGQKVIAKQADRVTAEFAANLERVLSGGDAPAAGTAAKPAPTPLPRPQPLAASPAMADAPSAAWVKAAAILGGTATAVGLVNLWLLLAR